MTEFRLPDIGEGLHEAEIVAWLVNVGDRIDQDQPVVEVLTDKAQVQLPSPYAGTVTALGAEVGEVVKVGSVLVVLDGAEPGGPSPARSTVSPPAAALAPPAGPALSPPVGSPPVAPAAAPLPVPAPASASDRGRGRVKAAPAVRKLAVDLGVDIAGLTGTGPEGRVTAADVQAASAAPERAVVKPLEGEASRRAPIAAPAGSPLGQLAPGEHPLRGIRRRTAEVMTTSWSTIPHITSLDELDASALVGARQQLRESAPPALADALTFTPFLVAAVAAALREFPAVNASLNVDASTLTVHAQINIGIAVATDHGLVVPVLRDAAHRRFGDLATELARLTASARSGAVTPSELTGGTCTVTNFGALGGRFATPLIRPPEVAIVGFGAIRPRPIVVDGAVVARPTLPVSLSCDHRVVDGDLATAFLEHVKRVLAAPVLLLGVI